MIYESSMDGIINRDRHRPVDLVTSWKITEEKTATSSRQRPVPINYNRRYIFLI